MKSNPEDYPVFIMVGKEEYYFADDIFCCNCGKKGMWLRRDEWDGEDFVVICTQCKHFFSLSDVCDIDFKEHALNQKIFDCLIAKEIPYKMHKNNMVDSIKSLELSEQE